MPAPSLPLEGAAAGVLDGRRPMLMPDTDPVFIENGAMQSESPAIMQSLHPTGGGFTLMVVEQPFTYVFDAVVKSFYAGRTYLMQTSVYNALVAAGMAVTA